MDLSLLIAAFIAGALTVLAPCVFSALPILLAKGVEGYQRARRVIAGLLVSIFVFTFLLKVSTSLLFIPVSFWQGLSGSIIAWVGLTMVWPNLYAKLAVKLKLETKSAKLQQKAMAQNGPARDYLLGGSLGPVFSACSPTYALIVAIILPNQPLVGIIYLLAFLIGLGALLSLVSLGGRTLVSKMRWSVDPYGKFKRGIGFALIVVGLAIISGLDRQILSYLVDNGLYDWQVRLENSLR